MNKTLVSTIAISACLALTGGTAMHKAQAAEVKIVADVIGGVVTSAKGPEAGVWVIAETKDLPTPYAKIVVTDDQGRYVLPELPKAKYKIWVRGYGLVDSKPVDGAPGEKLDLTAVVAPDGRSAAEVYPAMYWLALANIPKGDLSADDVMLAVKQCLQCHQLGDKSTREILPGTAHLGTFASSLDLWDRRVKSGPAGGPMNGAFLAMGDQRSLFADWTDRIAKGEYPKDQPPRPTGIERNVVLTEWDWGRDYTYMHDAAASDVRDPTVNANGLVYGPGQTDDTLYWMNPVTNEVGEVPIPSTAPKVGFGTKDGKSFMPSPYWGEDVVWFSAALPRSSAVDQKGRGWIAARMRPTDEQPAFCKQGSNNKFAKYFPIAEGDKQVAVYDPKTKKLEQIDVCFDSDHNQFGPAKLVGNKIFFGQKDTIGWVDADIWDKTHNAEASQGWVPAILDTNGDGKVTPGWTEPNEPVDPKRDHRIKTTGGLLGCYAIAASPKDGSIWCSGIGTNQTRHLTRISLGSNPPQTALAETYEPPATFDGIPVLAEGGIDVDGEGIVWQNWRGTDQVTAFDRRKCRVLNGPTATGKHCPEGWTFYRHQELTMGGGTKLNADFLYLMDVDRHNALGLGDNAIMQQPTNSDGLLVLQPKTNTWTKLHIPYPMGFLTRAINGRIDDAKGGWKGRGIWTSFANVPIWHIEGGKGQKPKLVKIQIRPDPLAD